MVSFKVVTDAEVDVSLPLADVPPGDGQAWRVPNLSNRPVQIDSTAATGALAISHVAVAPDDFRTGFLEIGEDILLQAVRICCKVQLYGPAFFKRDDHVSVEDIRPLRRDMLLRLRSQAS